MNWQVYILGHFNCEKCQSELGDVRHANTQLRNINEAKFILFKKKKKNFNVICSEIYFGMLSSHQHIDNLLTNNSVYFLSNIETP